MKVVELEGKLPPKLLEEYVLSVLRKRDPRVIVGPSIGEDAAIIDMGDRVLVVHSDPITGAIENIGWFAVHIACNDVATRGARPLWLLPVIMVPTGRVDIIKEIVEDMRRAADEVGATVVGGHTELTPGIGRPIISMTAIGEVKKNEFLTTSNCRPGDHVILTKGVAIEGTAIIAKELEHVLKARLPSHIIEEGKKFMYKISVVKDAMIAKSVGGVHAMHDPTEGGIACGLQELAIASGLGIIAYEDKMPISSVTKEILRTVNGDPLRTISSGSLLIVADPSRSIDIVNTLKKNGIVAGIIGEMVEDRNTRLIYRVNGSTMSLKQPIEDELWRILREILY